MDNTKTIETERLILRKFTMDDAEAMYTNWASDPLTTKHLSWETYTSVDDAKETISKWLEGYEEGSYNWVVEIKDTHEIIGSICSVGTSKKNNTVTLGYCYGSKYWNHGYASEALRGVIEYLIKDQGFYLVEAHHVTKNPASGRVMQKAGMKYDGTFRLRKLGKDGLRDDLVAYSITKDEL